MLDTNTGHLLIGGDCRINSVALLLEMSEVRDFPIHPKANAPTVSSRIPTDAPLWRCKHRLRTWSPNRRRPFRLHMFRLPPLVEHIPCVFSIGAQPKMAEAWARNAANDVNPRLIVPDAATDIARVQGKKARRDRKPHCNLKGLSVGQVRPVPLAVGSVAVMDKGSIPEPTRLGGITPINTIPGEWTRRGTLVRHRSYSFGVTPPAVVRDGAGATACLNFTT
jgi:hypothetical protein